jgi:hypothetical protein
LAWNQDIATRGFLRGPYRRGTEKGAAFPRRTEPARNEIAAERTITCASGAAKIGMEGVVEELHFDGDPAVDSTRRRLERIMFKEESRPNWKWLGALAAGGTAVLFWQLRRRTAQVRNNTHQPPKRSLWRLVIAKLGLDPRSRPVSQSAESAGSGSASGGRTTLT